MTETPKVSLSAQVSALRLIVNRASPATMVKGGLAVRRSEAELLSEQLRAALNTLRIIELRAPEIREILWGSPPACAAEQKRPREAR